MKIFLECPNCHNKTILQSEKSTSSNNVKMLLEKKSYCENCKKRNLGNIGLRVIKFESEREATSLDSSKVPTKLDPSTISKEQLEQNKMKNNKI